jgi:hypothetical protein
MATAIQGIGNVPRRKRHATWLAKRRRPSFLTADVETLQVVRLRHLSWLGWRSPCRGELISLTGAV